MKRQPSTLPEKKVATPDGEKTVVEESPSAFFFPPIALDESVKGSGAPTKLVDKWIEALSQLLRTAMKGAVPYKTAKNAISVPRDQNINEDSQKHPTLRSAIELF